MEQNPQRVVAEVFAYALLTVVILLIGVDFFRAYLAFIIEPYEDLYWTWIEPYFTGDGKPYLQAFLLFVAIGIMLKAFRLSIWLAKVVIGIFVARSALWWFQAADVAQPSITLIMAAGASALLLVFMMLRRGGLGG